MQDADLFVTVVEKLESPIRELRCLAIVAEDYHDDALRPCSLDGRSLEALRHSSSGYRVILLTDEQFDALSFLVSELRAKAFALSEVFHATLKLDRTGTGKDAS